MRVAEDELHKAMVLAEMLTQARAELCRDIAERRNCMHTKAQFLIDEIDIRTADNNAHLKRQADEYEVRLGKKDGGHRMKCTPRQEPEPDEPSVKPPGFKKVKR